MTFVMPGRGALPAGRRWTGLHAEHEPGLRCPASSRCRCRRSGRGRQDAPPPPRCPPRWPARTGRSRRGPGSESRIQRDHANSLKSGQGAPPKVGRLLDAPRLHVRRVEPEPDPVVQLVAAGRLVRTIDPPRSRPVGRELLELTLRVLDGHRERRRVLVRGARAFHELRRVWRKLQRARHDLRRVRRDLHRVPPGDQRSGHQGRHPEDDQETHDSREVRDPPGRLPEAQPRGPAGAADDRWNRCR